MTKTGQELLDIDLARKPILLLSELLHYSVEIDFHLKLVFSQMLIKYNLYLLLQERINKEWAYLLDNFPDFCLEDFKD